jgi:SAM-dependent methyltransferase
MTSDYKAKIYDSYVSTRGPGGAGRVPDRITSGVQRARSLGYYRAKLAKWLPSGLSSSILDLGCGQGLFLVFLLEQGYGDVTGVDISAEQVVVARAQAAGARIHEMDALEFLADKKEMYDCVTALDLIEHLEKKEVMVFLDLAFKALKPGGRLILQTPNAASPWGMAVRYGDFTHGCCFTPQALSQLLALAGFADTQFQEAGPLFKGVVSSARFVLWKLLSLLHRLYNLVETGRVGEGIYTRVFQCCSRKP